MARRIVLAMAVTFFAVALVRTAAHSGNDDPGYRFSHKLHIVEVEVDCEDCHEGAASATASAANLLPSTEVCTTCHDADEVNEFGYSGPEAPDREVIFSHQKHLTTVGAECTTCHTGIAGAERPPSGLPEMAVCVDCHSENEMSDACATCHTHVELRRPVDHVADWILDHEEIARDDAELCETCHRQTWCQECHDGAALGLAVRGETDAPVDRMSPKATAHEGNDLLILQRSHDLNYRFTHGTEVRAKTSDCAVCHDTQEFCAACHSPEDDYRRFRPVWHELSGFIGGGGGQHAVFARNDIEVCAACHDRTAADPTCLRCHKNITSPHSDGFMEDVEGPWHDEDDAVCFVCHDAGSRKPGVGFCGKCHGDR